MSEDYRSMWVDLGLDLAAHDALLGVLGQAYQDNYLAQQNRPEGMGYFDFVMSEVHGLRINVGCHHRPLFPGGLRHFYTQSRPLGSYPGNGRRLQGRRRYPLRPAVLPAIFNGGHTG